MKKLFVLMAAAFAMVACQTDINEVGVVADGVATVEFEVGAPQMRSYSDGMTATVLQYAVYEVKADKSLNYLENLTAAGDEAETLVNGAANVKIELANNKKYAVIFWASAAVNAPYTFNPAEKTVTVDYNNAECNDESRDAFYAYKEFEVKGAATLGVELRRPFAQVNVGTSDLAEAAKSNFVPSTSALVVKNVCNVLNLATGEATGGVDVTFKAEAIPAGEDFPYNKAEYKYLAMSYVLVGKDKGSYDVTYTITAGDNTVITNTIGAVPMQANYRTNIYGKLLTSTTDVNVEIKPGYNEEDNNVEAPVVVAVATAQEFNEAIANAKVGEIILSEDITLDGSLVFGAPTRASNNLPGRAIVIDGNDKTLKVTKAGTGRVIDFTSETNGASLTLKNLTIENNVSWIERIINYNTNGHLTLEGVKIINAEGCSCNYAVNLPGSSDNAVVTIKDSEIWAGAITLNIWGEKTLANITNSKLYVVDDNAVEGYAVVSLNNAGENAAHNSTVNVEGGEVKVIYEGEGETNPSSAFRDATVGSTINISDSTVVEGEIKIPVVNVVYEGYNEFYSFTTLQAAIDKVQADKNGTVRLIKDLVLTEPIVVAESEHNVVLDLNGHTLSAVDNSTGSYGLITNRGNLTVVGPGKLQLSATNNRAWNAYSSVISNTVGGNLVLDGGVVIEHLGGTDMAYGIDNLTNGKGTYAVTVINGATVKSTYSSVRQFLNGVEATNELYVNAGTQLVSPNRAVFFQDPSKNPNTGKLYIDAAASVTGKVHLSVTQGSTEWPVEVSVASAALINGSQVTYSNVPAGYQVIEENGIWTVIEATSVSNAAELQAALDNAKKGDVIILAPGNYGKLYLRPTANTNVTKNVDWIGNNYRYETYSLYEDITILGTTGTVVDAIEIEGGTYYNTNHSQSATYPIMLSLIELKNFVIDGVTFTGNGGTDPQGYGNAVNLSGQNIKVNGLTLKNCVLNNDANNARLLYKTEGTTHVHTYTYDGETYTFTPSLKDITVTGCTLNGGYMGLELREAENVTITNNVFKVANRNILLPVNSGCTYSGAITITGNTSINAKERFVRADGTGDAVVVIKNNTITNYQGSDTDYIKVTNGNNVTIENNTLN